MLPARRLLVPALALLVALTAGCTPDATVPGPVDDGPSPLGAHDAAAPVNGWDLLTTGAACQPAGAIPAPTGPVTTWTAVDECRALATGPAGLQVVTASGAVALLDPLTGMTQVTAVAANEGRVWVAGFEGTAPALRELGAGGSQSWQLPSGTTAVVSVVAQQERPWIALAFEGGKGAVVRPSTAGLHTMFELTRTPTAMAAGANHFAVAVVGDTGAKVVHGSNNSANNKQTDELVAGSTVTRMAGEGAMSAAVVERPDGPTRLWVDDGSIDVVGSGTYRAGEIADAPAGSVTSFTLAGGALFATVTRGGTTQVLTGGPSDATLVPDPRVPVGATPPLLSGVRDTLWVLGDTVQVLKLR